jgi:hypothetical protein
MITDLLAPVMTIDGIGTISTLAGQPMLSKDLEFLDTDILIFEQKGIDLYMLEYEYKNENKRKNYKKIFVTSDAYLYTVDGWKNPEEIKSSLEESDKSGHQYNKLWGCIHKCILCGELYDSSSMAWSYCSNQCAKILSDKGKSGAKAMTSYNVCESLSEGWLDLKNIIFVRVEHNVEALKIKKIENNGEGIYVNNIYVSCGDIVRV